MPRHARIDLPGLLQHVIVRGIERRKIFFDDIDREDLVARLSNLLGETQTVCYAWALLDNHFHLLLMPTQISLAVIMRRLLTGYAVSFNLRHKRAGHLFQNRYKSLVCDENSYLLELIRYIHLNPIRAGIISDTASLEGYPWAGHQQMLGSGRFKLVADGDVLSLFSHNKSTARKAYRQFVADGLKDDIPKLSRGGRSTSCLLDQNLRDDGQFDDRILGGGLLVERVLGAADAVGQAKSDSLEELIGVIADYFGLDASQLQFPSKQRRLVRAKAVICFVAVRYYHQPGNQVAQRLGYSSSAVSRAVERGRVVFNDCCDLRMLVTK